jgi:hypothetical protein
MLSLPAQISNIDLKIYYHRPRYRVTVQVCMFIKRIGSPMSDVPRFPRHLDFPVQHHLLTPFALPLDDILI